jgi:acyl carrier protein
MLLESGWQGSPQLRILCGGEALPVKLAAQLLDKSEALWNLYGPTETTIWSSFSRVANNDGGITLGRPIANTQVYVLDDQLQPVPAGVTGHLHIGGSGLARGYLSRPDLTAEKFIPNHLSDQHGARLYRSGDLARYLPDGELEYVGRIDHQVKIRGFRIELGEIEVVLAAHERVNEVVVVARHEATGDRRLVAYIVAAQPDADSITSEAESTTGEAGPATNEAESVMNGAVSVAELREHARGQLPEYMVPSQFVLLEAMPLTPNGKVDRNALPAPDAAGQSSDYVAPRDAAEQMLADMWAEVLGVERVSVEANFFEIGGHSLLATQIISRVREGFQVEVALQSLFRAPTVRGLAALIGEARAAEGSHMGRIAALLNTLEHLSVDQAGELLDERSLERL